MPERDALGSEKSRDGVTATVEICRFHVFLSHNSRDKLAVERLAERLKRAGLEPWLDSWCLTPGGAWQDELADGIAASSAFACFAGPAGDGD